MKSPKRTSTAKLPLAVLVRFSDNKAMLLQLFLDLPEKWRSF
jgi:hypothetical protein